MMSQQVLGSPRTLGGAVAAVARAIGAPGAQTWVELHTVCWPLHDAESLRGAALLAESLLSAERPERLLTDHHRLFVGGPDRPPLAPTTPPAAAAGALALLLDRAGGPGLQPDLSGALHAYAVLLTAPPGGTDPGARSELVHEHLLTWGTRCLSRAQLGAQTFAFQGVATLGLGLLRHAAEDASL